MRCFGISAFRLFLFTIGYAIIPFAFQVFLRQNGAKTRKVTRKGLDAMGGLNIYKEQLNEYTVISNYFIDNYMEDANEAQLQVYFYLLRMASANLPVSVSDISNKFKHSEKDVLRALKYWELQKLLSLDYDENKNLAGIHFLSMPVENAKEVTIPQKVEPQDATFTITTQVPALAYEEAEPEVADPFAKPAYTADQLKNFKAQDNAAQLLYVAQAYVGKPLTVNDVKTIYYMWDVLHFSEDLIDYLIQYCVDRGKKDFRYMEKVALNWAEAGITTPKQAQKFATKYDKSVYTIMNALGKNNSTPTAKELEYIKRWTSSYGFDLDIIIEACDRTVLATDRNRFDYAEKILCSWQKANVHHKADIIKIDELHQKQKQTASKPNAANRFNQFTQTTYDFSALETQIISN